MAFTHLNNLLHVYKDCFHEEKSPVTKMIKFLKNDENCFNATIRMVILRDLLGLLILHENGYL